MVTWNDMIYMVDNDGYRLKGVYPPESNKAATKAEIIAYLYVNEENLLGYDDNQLVPYQMISKGLYVDAGTQNITDAGSTFSFTIEDAGEWVITGIESWLTVDATSGNGTATVTATVSQNTGVARSGTLTITDSLSSNTFDIVVNQDAYVGSYQAISLGKADTSNDACTDAVSSPSTYYIYDSETFASATYLSGVSTGGKAAAAGYYSDESIARYWNGSAFTGQNLACPI